ncbi:YbaB/EbfC family nucleoid-associated protein [Levilactobacillus bambusae]|uniref:Nucleoid-associated protein DCM90_08015 n=1 Tax=Levilactobacillus bambusae TaxID=2024736 RepID=A0A2V1MZ77_9LACO|nr:YbaB/EbfC family nucleoid-associated protein [Levilactobacillus bambusae]PWF99389.1 YbaB/EbfC family nucleoid-associated protein [Levilactobacillus bambusae]
MPGMGNMMKQMRQMQQQMQQDQAALDATEFTGKAPDDMVVVTFTGDRTMKDIQMKPEVIDPDDPDMLGDLITAAVNDAMKQISDQTQQTLGKYTAGMNIPGL